jgi:hypothetical protein
MTHKWNMSEEYWWNNSDRVKQNFLGQETVPESHYPPQTPHRVPWLARWRHNFGVMSQLDAFFFNTEATRVIKVYYLVFT